MILNKILGWIIFVIIPFVFLVVIKPEKTSQLKYIKRNFCFILIVIFALGIISSLLSLLQLLIRFRLPNFLSLWGFRPKISDILYPILYPLFARLPKTVRLWFIFPILDLIFSLGMFLLFIIKVKQLIVECNSFVSNKKENSEPLLNFSKMAFRVFFEFILWINLIVFTVVGGLISYFITYSSGGFFSNSSEGNPVPGIFIGLIIGLLFDIVFGGLVATYLNIDKNLEILTKNSSDKEVKSLSNNDNAVRKEEQVKRKTEINSVNATINKNTGKTKLIVERGNNFLCSSIPFEIFIDNKKAFSIKNASKFTGFIKNGIHSIYAEIDNNTKSEIIKFNTVNPEINFRIRVLEIGKIKLEKII